MAPGLEALHKIRTFYIEKGIDILKDVVSIPGVSMQYLLRGSIERGANLWSPGEDENQMLKGAVLGGPSLVFTRHHEVGGTRFRSHQQDNPPACRKTLGYDANAMYLSTMLKDMPCGKGQVRHLENPAAKAPAFTRRVMESEVSLPGWFCFAAVDIEVPRNLWEKFVEMCLFLISKEVPPEAVPQRMHG